MTYRSMNVAAFVAFYLAALMPPPAYPAAAPCRPKGCVACCPVAKPCLRTQVIETSVIVGVGGDECGSGTLFTHKGKLYVLTAAHVVADAYATRYETTLDGEGKVTKVAVQYVKPITVRSRLGKSKTVTPARIVRYGADWEKDGPDLAVLSVDGPLCGWRPATLATGSPVEAGESVWYCGFGGGIPWNLQKSIVNQNDGRYLVVNGGAWYGHSGSGVFVLRGGRYVLVGVVVAHMQLPRYYPRTPAECEPLREVRKFLEGVVR